MRKLYYTLIFISIFSVSGNSQNTIVKSKSLKTDQFHIQNYLSEPYFKKTYLFTQLNSSLLFDSLKVVSVNTAIKKACSVRGFKIHWVALVLSKDSLQKSYWEMHNDEKRWLEKDAPRRYKQKVEKKGGNGIGVIKIIKVNAVTGEILEIKEDVSRVVMHF